MPHFEGGHVEKLTYKMYICSLIKKLRAAPREVITERNIQMHSRPSSLYFRY
jgi:hypothetical protein